MGRAGAEISSKNLSGHDGNAQTVLRIAIEAGETVPSERGGDARRVRSRREPVGHTGVLAPPGIRPARASGPLSAPCLADDDAEWGKVPGPRGKHGQRRDRQ